MTIQSTINDSSYYNSEEDDSESDTNSDSKVATQTSDGGEIKVTDTDTNNRNSSRKLLINRLIQEITPVSIWSIDQTIVEDAAGSGDTLHTRRTILFKEIFMDTVHSPAHVFQTPANVNRHGTYRTTPRDGNTDIESTRLYCPVRIGGSTTGSPSSTGSQYIISPRGSIGTQWSRNDQPFYTSINGIYSKHRDPAPTCSKLIGQKFTDESSADVNLHCRMNLTRDAVLIKIPNFVNMGILSVHKTDELRSVFIATTIIRTPTDDSNWLPTGHRIGEVTADRVSKMGSEQDYNAKTDFETRRENQDFGRQNNSMSQPPLDLNTIGTNTINIKMSHIDSIPVRTKILDPTPLIIPTEF